MSYQTTLDYLYHQLPMYQRIGAVAFKKDLTNTLALCEALGNPHQTFPTIHIGGTNGKGSTAHTLAAVLQAAGLKTGLYISPHYKDFRERIKIDGVYISKKYVVDFVKKHKSLFESIQPSFFEMTVAMAFDYFATEGVDVAVIEVGLGGRLDSTNVITPLLSVITNISYDHTDMLGDTLPQIAFEKAGIIKPEVPVIIGEEHPETRDVFIDQAQKQKAPIIFASQNIDIQCLESEWAFSTYDVFYKKQLLFKNLKVNLSGDFQIKNIATVVETIEQLKKIRWGYLLTDEVVRHGLANIVGLTKFMGRWQVIGENPIILCDSAHNEGGLTMVMQQLKALKYQTIHIVFGMVKDKDASKALRLMPTDAVYYFCKANIPRGLPADSLRDQAVAFGLNGKAYPSVRRALATAKRRAKPNDFIFVGGSIFVVAEVI